MSAENTSDLPQMSSGMSEANASLSTGRIFIDALVLVGRQPDSTVEDIRQAIGELNDQMIGALGKAVANFLHILERPISEPEIKAKWKKTASLLREAYGLEEGGQNA